MTIERTTLSDGSTQLVEHNDAGYVMVARQIDGQPVWVDVFPEGHADATAAIEGMEADPAGYLWPDAIAVHAEPPWLGAPEDAIEITVEGPNGVMGTSLSTGEPDFLPRLIVERDEDGYVTSAVGYSPGGRPFAIEYEVGDTPLVNQLKDLGFDGRTIEGAYASARAYVLRVGKYVDLADATDLSDPPATMLPPHLPMSGPRPTLAILDETD